jgi:Flp pilus assembly protein TadB/tetratricopeptide (TPR) repeat protein
LNWEKTYEAGNRAFAGGLYPTALTGYLDALERATTSGDHQAIAHTQRALAKTYLELDQVEDAKQAAAQAAALDREFWGYDNQQVAEDKFLLAESLRRLGSFEESRQLFEAVLALRVSFVGEAHDDSLAVIVKLIWLDAQQDRTDILADRLRRAGDIFARLHPSGTLTKALSLKPLLQQLRDTNREPEAELIAQRILQAMRTVFGGAHPELRHAFQECAAVMKMADKNLSAWRLQAQANILESRESANLQAYLAQPTEPMLSDETVEENSPPPAQSQPNIRQSTEQVVMQNYHRLADDFARNDIAPTLVEMPYEKLSDAGNRALASGLYDSAISNFSSALENARRLNDQHAIGETLRKLSKSFLAVGRMQEAQQTASEAETVERNFWGTENEQVAECMYLLAEALRRQGEFTRARDLFEHVLAVRDHFLGEAHDETLAVWTRLIWCDLEENNIGRSIERIRQAYETFSKAHPQGVFSHFLDMRFLLNTYIARNHLNDAETIFQRAQSAMRTALGDQHPEIAHLVEEGTAVLGTICANQTPTAGATADADAPDSFSSDWQDATNDSTSVPPDFSDPADEAVHSVPPLDAGPPFDRYLRQALTLTNLSIEPERIRMLWMRAAAGCGILSAVIYLFSGYWYLMCDAFVTGCLICTAALCIFLASAAFMHQRKLDAQVPDALEIIVSSLRAGAPIAEIFKVLSETLPPPLQAEFEGAMVLMKEGRTPQAALRELTVRVRSHDLVLLSDAIQVSQDTRRNLADQVATIAAASRSRQSTRSSISLSSPRMQVLLILSGAMSLMVALGVMFEPAFGASLLNGPVVRIFLYMAFVVIAMGAFMSASPVTADRLVQADATAGAAANANDPIAGNIGKLTAYLHKMQMEDRIRRELSNFVEMVVMYVESGVSLPQAVHKVRTTATASCPTLCRELEQSLANPTSYKNALPDAFKSIGEKYGVAELATLASTIAAAEKTNSSVAMQFTEQAKFLRNHIDKVQKERAAAGFTIAMVIGVAFAVIVSVFSMIFGGH